MSKQSYCLFHCFSSYNSETGRFNYSKNRFCSHNSQYFAQSTHHKVILDVQFIIQAYAREETNQCTIIESSPSQKREIRPINFILPVQDFLQFSTARCILSLIFVEFRVKITRKQERRKICRQNTRFSLNERIIQEAKITTTHFRRVMYNEWKPKIRSENNLQTGNERRGKFCIFVRDTETF